MPVFGASATIGVHGVRAATVTPPGWSALETLQVANRELLLFALFWFLLGMVDELAVDVVYGWLRLTGRARTPRLPATTMPLPTPPPLIGPIAVLIPAWQESAVIGITVAHLLAAWPQAALWLYVGCYRNDPATLAAAAAAGAGDARLRLVIHPGPGPTTKADCLNHLYAALCDDEADQGMRFRAIVLQDAEDMVHPLALDLIDAALSEVDFVQLPVRPELPGGGRWVAGHYADEFAEAHAKALVVRAALGAALPAAGVGCGFTREIIERVERLRHPHDRSPAAARAPFAADCLTEDYVLGLVIARCGGRGRFLRLRDATGALIATRSFFPASLPDAIRQKTRWIHGIALQGWDRLGWEGCPVEIWMALRDRRGPLTALVLAVAYALVLMQGLLLLARDWGAQPRPLASPSVGWLVALAVASCLWRAALRGLFTAREYGWAEGVRAVARIPVANIVTMIAGGRAVVAYGRSLSGARPVWDKTMHRDHPATAARLAAPGVARR